jgi:prevent-host-death family protein
MKHLHVAQDIVPLGEFKTESSRLLKRLRSSRRPLVLTQNGKATAVVVTPEEFDELNERKHVIAAIERGLEDLAAGRTIDDSQLGKELEAEFGK